MTRQSFSGALRRLAFPIYRVPSMLRASLHLKGSNLGRHVRVLFRGHVRVQGAVNVDVGDGVWFNGGPVHNELYCGPVGSISIGTRTGFNYGVSLKAKQSIKIGCDCAFGAMVMVRDFDGRRLAPVVIGDRVWLAHCAVIEPGVTIGDDAVISAGTVVMEDVPPRMIAIGNPARCMPLLALRRPSDPQSTTIGPAHYSPPRS
jgi:maltose O-acetyltransferase